MTTSTQATNDPSKVIKTVSDDYTIRYWYDPHTRLWIAYVQDENGCQTGAAEYVPKARLPIALAHLQLWVADELSS